MNGGGNPIGWCDVTINPGRGCAPVSPGCVNCYASNTGRRFAGEGGAYEGLVQLGRGPARWTGLVRFLGDKLREPGRLPAGQWVFVGSMTDHFHDGYTFEEIAAVHGMIAAHPEHVFVLATKRLPRAEAFYNWIEGRGRHPVDVCAEAAQQIGRVLPPPDRARWPLPNLVLLASVEDQRRANERLPILGRLPVGVRGVSAEPLLERVELARWMPWLQWVIFGGESGPRARFAALSWFRDGIAECKAWRVPVWMKQIGGLVHELGRQKDNAGRDVTTWPADLAAPALRMRPPVIEAPQAARRAA